MSSASLAIAWRSDEIEILKGYLQPDLTDVDYLKITRDLEEHNLSIQHAPQRTKKAVKLRIARLRNQYGMKSDRHLLWSEEERLIVQPYVYARTPDWEHLASLLGNRSISAIKLYVRSVKDAKLKDITKPKVQYFERNCLCCGIKFRSEDRRRNWMCAKCR